MEPDAELAMSKAFSSKGGHRTILAIPLLREGEALGTIVIRREVDPAVFGQADRAPGDVRRPGGHRDRERAPVQESRRGSQ